MPMTVDELARTADVPVRTIREYQTVGLLPPPERRGRVGTYDDEHLHRLRLIGRLQHRGYSLAGIRDLLDAWASGRTLPALLGVELGPIALDETPAMLTSAELTDRMEGLGGPVSLALEAGLAEAQADGRFAVRSPALLALVLAGEIRRRLGGLADVVAERFAAGVWAPAVSDGRTDELPPLLHRDRLLLIQAAASLLTHELGRALLEVAESAPAGERLRDAIEGVRVGAIADAAGRAERRPS